MKRKDRPKGGDMPNVKLPPPATESVPQTTIAAPEPCANCGKCPRCGK